MTLLRDRRFFQVFLVVVACVTFASAQGEDSQASSLGFPRVSFELNWKDADPHQYEIAVDIDGRASYGSQAKVAQDEEPGEPYTLNFTLSKQTTARIFDLASATKNFEGDFDYKGPTRMAQTGTKTLKFQTGGKISSTSFNWSQNVQIMELTTIFQKLSTTLELGRQLRHAQRFDKLGVEGLLKRMEEMQKGNDLIELQVIAPVLQRIVNDNYSMNVARQRATRLLAAANAGK